MKGPKCEGGVKKVDTQINFMTSIVKTILISGWKDDDDLASGKHSTQLRKPVPQQCVVDM